jgi:hypothetical protein
MLREGLKMPKRVGSGLFSEVIWQRPAYRILHQLLNNPTYAGAYSYGRRRHFLRLVGEEPRRATRQLPMDQWRVLIKDAHPGYISWEEYLRNRERIRKNWNGGRPGSAAGRGQALVQGLIRCGKCGGRMYVRYRKDMLPSGTVYTQAQYSCAVSRSGTPLGAEAGARSL